MKKKMAFTIAGLSILLFSIQWFRNGWLAATPYLLVGLAMATITYLFGGPIKRLAIRHRTSLNLKWRKNVLSLTITVSAIALLVILYELGFTNWFLLLIYLIGTILGVALWFYIILRMLASRDTFFTDKVRQGRVHFVMVGGVVKTVLANLKEQGKWVNPNNGEIWKVEFSADGNITKGRKLDVEYWKNLSTPLPDITRADQIYELMNVHNPIPQFLRIHFGWYFMSWNPDAKLWEGMFSRFQAKGERDGDTTATDANIELVYRSEITNALFPSGTYGIDASVVTGIATGLVPPTVGDAETSENVPVKLKFAAEIAVTNALTAQFREPSNPYFITALMKSVESAAKGIVSGMTYDTLTTSTTEGQDSPWFRIVTELNGDQAGGNPSIISKNGVMLVAIHLIGQKITDAEIEKTVTQRNAAKRARQVAIEAAEGAKKVTLLNNIAEADTIEKLEKARLKIEIDRMVARKENDPTGQFAKAEALKEWKQMRYLNTGGGSGAVPFLNVDIDGDKGGEAKKTENTKTEGTV